MLQRLVFKIFQCFQLNKIEKINLNLKFIKGQKQTHTRPVISIFKNLNNKMLDGG